MVADATFNTPIGGRRTVPLSDGSKVEMNTATVLRTAVTDESREIWLDKGEAYFEVAHHKGRPFVVHAGSRTVTVLGTKFSVRRDGEKVTVSVVEGKVRVDDANAQAMPAAIITAGDVAIARGPSTLLTARSEERVENALAWRDGMLKFDQSSLGEAATEFNRYNRKRIEITDSETANIRIGGTFQASNVDAFVRLLRDAYADPDFMGWEVKQYGVSDFVRFRPKSPVTLMTPEPTGGVYKVTGVAEFMRRFG